MTYSSLSILKFKSTMQLYQWSFLPLADLTNSSSLQNAKTPLLLLRIMKVNARLLSRNVSIFRRIQMDAVISGSSQIYIF